MKKFLLVIMMLLALVCAGCNQQMIDIEYTFERAIMKLPNGEIIDDKVQTWRDYKKDNQMQVKVNGVYYLIDKRNIVLIHHD